MEILSNRISATPRSKYVRYGYGDTYISGSSGSANIDLSNYVKLTGETEQTIEGNVLATGDIIAYSTGKSVENYPIASSTALGTIKVGQNLTIDEDGTLNAQAGGGTSNWSELQGKPTLLTDTNIKKWDDNSHTHTNKAVLDTITADSIHTHSNKSYLDSINQNLSTTSDANFNSVKATGDIIAYSTGTASAPFKYWKPSVSADGNLSWTNSTSETVPDSVNIKGAKGDTGSNGIISKVLDNSNWIYEGIHLRAYKVTLGSDTIASGSQHSKLIAYLNQSKVIACTGCMYTEAGGDDYKIIFSIKYDSSNGAYWAMFRNNTSSSVTTSSTLGAHIMILYYD